MQQYYFPTINFAEDEGIEQVIDFMEKAQKEINKVLGAIPILIISSHDERLLKKFTKKSILLINGNVVMYDETSVVLKYYRSDKFKEKYLNEKI